VILSIVDIVTDGNIPNFMLCIIYCGGDDKNRVNPPADLSLYTYIPHADDNQLETGKRPST